MEHYGHIVLMADILQAENVKYCAKAVHIVAKKFTTGEERNLIHRLSSLLKSEAGRHYWRKNRIRFYNFSINEKSIYFDCEINTDSVREQKMIYFLLPSQSNRVRNDLLAYALSTLTGDKFDYLEMDLPITENAVKNLSAYTKAKIKAPIDKTTEVFKFGENAILNFSGGFDSLAALCCMPQGKTKLVSTDFQGWFARETHFFSDFDTNIVTTNFRKASSGDAYNLAGNSWTFMGCVDFLLAETLEADSICFGSIMEASKSNFARWDVLPAQYDVMPFCFAGLKEVKYMRGLTEVGTAILMSKYMPEYINDSLKSLASDGSEKRKRKETLISIILDKMNIRNVKIEQTECRQKTPFGKEFAVDFLCLYIIKNKGIEEAGQMVTDIPEEIVRCVDKMHLTFYEKYDTRFLNDIPSGYRETYLEKLRNAGIELYMENDWEELKQVIFLLEKYER